MMQLAKTRILFVDDEPLVLSGLRRMLRPLSNEWDMAFVESGAQALEVMAADSYNVIVSDMRMPGMNGAQLLQELAKTYPKTVRIILSGHADKNLIVQCVGSAHQFLAKPCEPDALKTAIGRARSFESSIKSDVVREIVAKMHTLPSVPVLFHEITKKLQDDNCSLEDVAEIIASDVAMTAKLLKLVNSAFFGLRRQISSPIEAVSFLGVDTIKALVLGANAFGCFEEAPGAKQHVEQVWNHSVLIARWCKQIARHEERPRAEVEECFISGLLHDVGKLALSVNSASLYLQALKLAKAENIPDYVAEEKVFGADHADIGGALLSLWGLPARVVDAISFHHHPSRSVVEGFGALAAVHASDAFESADNEATSRAPAVCDESFFERQNLSAHLESWKDLRP